MFIFGSIAAVILVIFVILYNNLISKRNQVDNIFSTCDVLLQKRYDLIPNLVETVKGYVNHESEVFERLAYLRSCAFNSNLSSDDKIKINDEITERIELVLNISESYPELKSSEHFLKLQAALNEIEEQISAARRAYNASVTDYNTALQTIPTNLIGSICRFSPRKLFEASSDKIVR
jgi:LemA protein